MCVSGLEIERRGSCAATCPVDLASALFTLDMFNVRLATGRMTSGASMPLLPVAAFGRRGAERSGGHDVGGAGLPWGISMSVEVLEDPNLDPLLPYFGGESLLAARALQLPRPIRVDPASITGCNSPAPPVETKLDYLVIR